MEVNQIVLGSNSPDRHRLKQQAHRPIGVKGRNDQAGAAGKIPVVFRRFTLAEDDAGSAGGDRLFSGLAVIAAEDNIVFMEGLTGTGKRQNDIARDLIKFILRSVQNMAFQRAQQVEDRHGLHSGIAERFHILLRDIAGGNETGQGSVLMGDGEGGQPGSLLLQYLPGMGDGYAFSQRGGRIVINIGNLGADGTDIQRRLKPEAVQQERGFGVQMADPPGDIVVFSQRVIQGRISHGGDDGIRIRIFMT